MCPTGAGGGTLTPLANFFAQGILRLGATQEGIFRKHMVLADGHIRDSVYFSIVDNEWPEVKARLEARLGLTRQS